jgi:hypothetical protein
MGQLPEGYGAEDVARLKKKMLSTDDGEAFYNAFQFNQYDPKNKGDDEADSEDDGISDDAPAKLTQLPTSSTNMSRPRTVAAGYDEQRKVMTVMFRDGTIYNYYEVTPGEWSSFSASFSKGRPWLNRRSNSQGSDGLFIGKPRGEADTAGLDSAALADIYRIARTSQYRYSYHGYVPRSAHGKAYAPPPTKVRRIQGKNSASAGRAHRAHKP